MKKQLTLLSIFILLLILNSHSQNFVVITKNDSGQTILLDSSQVLEIKLPSIPSTGYGWYVTNLNQNIITKSGNWSWLPTDTTRGLVGQIGTQTTIFSGVSQGTTQLTLEYKRPWENNSTYGVFNIVIISNGNYTGNYRPPEPVHIQQSYIPDGCLPTCFSWKDQNGCTPVKDQQLCGDCWAYASVATLESNILIQDGVTKDISEEFVTNCYLGNDNSICQNIPCTGCGDHGGGGTCAHQVWLASYTGAGVDPITGLGGAVYESDDPWTSIEGQTYPQGFTQSCYLYASSYPHYETIDSYSDVDGCTPNNDEIKDAIYNYGPVWCAVNATENFQMFNPSFPIYTNGVFCDDLSFFKSPGDVDRTNHAVILVGWCDDESVTCPSGAGGGYWILKNSYNTSWGDNGYMKIAYGTDNIGYAANYIVYKGGISHLWMKDVGSDDGTQPDPDIIDPMWESPDIWVRNSADGFTTQVHQNPIYGQINYVYVHIRNGSCSRSTLGLGKEQLKTYWAKASTALTWPDNWDGNDFPGHSGVLEGNIISPRPSPLVIPRAYVNGIISDPIYDLSNSSITIPAISASGDAIIEIPWLPPNPNDYSYFGPDEWHFCMLARIETSPNSPYGMNFSEGTDINANTKNNNKIIWKNLTIVNHSPKVINTSSVMIKNVSNINAVTKFKFDDESDGGNSLLEYDSIYINLGQALFQKWNNGGKIGDSVEVYNDGLIHVLGRHSWIGNIILDSGEMRFITVYFKQFKQADSCNFNFDVSQYTSITNTPEKLIGGNTFTMSACPNYNIYGTLTPSCLSFGNNDTLTVTINNLPNGVPATICLYKENDILITKDTTGTGNQMNITFPNVYPTSNGILNVTVTSQNYIPYIGVIPVNNFVYNTTPLDITPSYSPSIWNNPTIVNSDITIESGATLTINNKIYLNQSSTFTVKNGGTLTINPPGEILGGCDTDNIWRGTFIAEPGANLNINSW